MAELGVSPDSLLDCDPDVFMALVDTVESRIEARKKARMRRRRR